MDISLYVYYNGIKEQPPGRDILRRVQCNSEPGRIIASKEAISNE
jgi:hypothetical protein